MSVALPIATSPSTYWFLTRGAGTVSLVLLTGALVLGIVEVSRWSAERWPRFIVDGLHRNISLLALVFLAVHIITSVLDTFAPLALKDAVVPFAATYRPLWLGLGALSFDILLAVALTSMIRHRLGYGAWKAVHWAAYASWPLAVLHGLGTGSDANQTWLLALTFACLVAVVTAVAWRITIGWPGQSGVRVTAACALALFPILLLVWVVAGPLGSNWAARAGTPTTLLAAVHPQAPAAPAPAPTTADTVDTGIRFPLTAQLSGTIHQSPISEAGLVEVDLKMKMSGGAKGTLDVGLVGQPASGGGVGLARSAVAMGPPIQPKLFGGTITSLQGSLIRASVSNAQGQTVPLTINLSIDQSTQTVSGTVSSSGSPTGEVG